MFPQYAQRNLGAEIALWLLITVGALLIPIIVIAICCIRRHWLRRPHIKLLEKRVPRMAMTMKPMEGLRSYNGPCTESTPDNIGLSSEKTLTSTFSRTNSLKKQHVHWTDGSTIPKLDNFHSVLLTESPSAHRRPPLPNSTLSNFIQTAIIPAGSTINSLDTNQFLTPSKEFTSVSVGSNSIM